MNDLFDKIVSNKGPLGQYAKVAEGYFAFPKLEGPISNRMNFNGKKVITWSVNDYLGLANHPEIRKFDAEAAKQYGSAYPMGARLMSGHTHLHEKLEDELADFVNKEKAYVLNFGYQGILSTVDSLVSKNDVIVYDIDCHACIVDGVRLHIGKRFTFQHNDIDSLVKNLERATKIAEKTGGGILVISEGVFGMRGEQGKIKEICALKSKYKFRLLVDDAHGFGTLGKTGAGAGEEQGVQDQIDVYFATFAKSMASTGAFIAGDKMIIDYLKYNMRSQVFAKSLQMQLVAGVLKRLEMLKTRPEIRSKLWDNVKALQAGLRKQNFDLGKTQSCVTPVFFKRRYPRSFCNGKRVKRKIFYFLFYCCLSRNSKGIHSFKTNSDIFS
jgi:glycine C-acetyltransferase